VLLRKNIIESKTMKSKELLGMNIIITLKVMKAKKLIASQKVENSWKWIWTIYG
jgi:hypothetical protein